MSGRVDGQLRLELGGDRYGRRQGGREQKMEALKKANAVRAARTTTRQRWRRGGFEPARQELQELLCEIPWWAETWPVDAALKAVPRIGKQRVARAVRECALGGARVRLLGWLTERQRQALIDWLGSVGGGGPRGGM